MTGDAEVILTTERLVLRRLRVDEADAVAEYKNDPEVARYQDWDLPYPVEEIAAKIAAYEQRPWPSPGAGLNVAIEYEGELIGDLGVGWDDAGTEAEIGYTLRLDHQGKGLATEAVAAVVERLFFEGVDRITSSLDPENVASIRVFVGGGRTHSEPLEDGHPAWSFWAAANCAILCSQTHMGNGTHMKSHLQDIADVRAVVQLYIDGASGDPAKLREAFHPDAHMFGHIGDMATYIPIGDFIGMVESSPSMAGPNYVADVRTVDVIGDAGVAVLVEHDYLGCDFVDYFTVARIDGRWWITNKTYAHTGGSPPAH